MTETTLGNGMTNKRNKPSQDDCHGDTPEVGGFGCHAVWVAPTLLGLLYTILALTGRLHFHTNDDQAIITILSGRSAAAPDGFTLMLQPWLGGILAWLYDHAPRGYWYEWVMLGLYCIGLLYILTALRNHGCRLAAILLATAAMGLGFLLWQPGFTLLAQFLTLAAVLPLILSLLPGKTPPASRFTLLSCTLFLLLGVAYRTDAAIICLAAGVVVFLTLSGRGLVRPSAAVRQSGLISLLLVTIAVGSLLVSRYGPLTPERDRWRQYNASRSALHDYRRTKYDPAWVQLYGLSADDYEMVRYSYCVDSAPFALETLQALPRNLPRLDLHSVLTRVAAKAGLAALPLLAIIALGCLRQPRLIVPAAFILLVCFALEWEYSHTFQRILLPPLATLAVVAAGATASASPRHRRLVSGACIALAAVTAAVAAPMIPPRCAPIAPLAVAERQIRDYCQSHNIDRLVLWGNSLGGDAAFYDLDRQGPVIHQLGRWNGSHPALLTALRQQFGDDIFRGIARPGTWLLLCEPPPSIPAEAFTRHRWSAGTRMVRVIDRPPFILYHVGPAPTDDPAQP